MPIIQNMMASRKTYSLLPVILAGVLFLFQCNSERTGSDKESRAEKEMSEQQTSAEKILTARTMGLAFLEENKLDEAENQFLTLISLAPEEAIGYANLGLVYLRMGKYNDAEKILFKALDLTPLDADIRLNLALVYKYQDEHEKFIGELEKAIDANPGHLQSLYLLAESFSNTTDQNAMYQRENYLRRTIKSSPANIVPRLYLIENLIRNGNPDEALVELEEIRRIFPEFSDEAMVHYNQAFDAIKANRIDDAFTSVMIFHNFLKLSNPYNNGITELKGFEGSAAGSPVFTFSEITPPLYFRRGIDPGCHQVHRCDRIGRTRTDQWQRERHTGT